MTTPIPIACVWFRDQVGWVGFIPISWVGSIPVSCLVRRDGSDPIFCLVARLREVTMDGDFTPLACYLWGSPVILFYFFFSLPPSSISHGPLAASRNLAGRRNRTSARFQLELARHGCLAVSSCWPRRALLLRLGHAAAVPAPRTAWASRRRRPRTARRLDEPPPPPPPPPQRALPGQAAAAIPAPRPTAPPRRAAAVVPAPRHAGRRPRAAPRRPPSSCSPCVAPLRSHGRPPLALPRLPSPLATRYRANTACKWVGVVRSIWADHPNPDLRGIYLL